MKARHHVAIQMEEEQQWAKDNGPIAKTADELWKYSGYTETSNAEIEYIDFAKISKRDICNLFSEKGQRRADIVWKHIRNPGWTAAQISKSMDINFTSIANALNAYYEIRRTNKKLANYVGSEFKQINKNEIT